MIIVPLYKYSIMSANLQEFPHSKFIEVVRNDSKSLKEFLAQVQNSNIAWVYQMIKNLHNMLSNPKEVPSAKLSALKVVRDLMLTAQIPCLTMIEVYILPIIFEGSTFRTQRKQTKRGEMFFIEKGHSQGGQAIRETGVKFVDLSTELLYLGSLLKRKRTLGSTQLRQSSQFVDNYRQFLAFGFGHPNSTKELNHIDPLSADSAIQSYPNKLQHFDTLSKPYSEYFVKKMMDSLLTQSNPLFCVGPETKFSNDLDMKALLKYGDTYITSPLIFELIEGLETPSSLIVKKNFLSLLSDFVVWSDIEAIGQITVNPSIQKIGGKIAEVKGEKGLLEGQNIYPQSKESKQAKQAFYQQFLKFVEIWARTIKNPTNGRPKSSSHFEMNQLYPYFKEKRRFVFPENLQLHKLESDYKKNSACNEERNKKLLEKLKLDDSNGYGRSSVNSEMHAKIPFKEVSENLNECLEVFFTLNQQEKELSTKFGKLLEFRENFDRQLASLKDEPAELDLQEAVDDGDALIENIDLVQPIYNDYKSNKISFPQFKERFEEIILEVDEPSQSAPSQKDHSIPNKVKDNATQQNRHVQKSEPSLQDKQVCEKIRDPEPERKSKGSALSRSLVGNEAHSSHERTPGWGQKQHPMNSRNSPMNNSLRHSSASYSHSHSHRSSKSRSKGLFVTQQKQGSVKVGRQAQEEYYNESYSAANGRLKRGDAESNSHISKYRAQSHKHGSQLQNQMYGYFEYEDRKPNNIVEGRDNGNLYQSRTVAEKKAGSFILNTAPKGNHFRDEDTGIEQDAIQEPEDKPTDNSYYGTSDIEARVRHLDKPLFKNCFDIDKEILQATRSKVLLGQPRNNQSILRKIGQTSTIYARDEYDQRAPCDGVSQSSYSQSNKFSYGDDSINYGIEEFSSRSRGSSFDSESRERSAISRIQNMTVEGRLLDTDAYQLYSVEESSDCLKRSLLRAKSLVGKNQDLEIGCLCSRDGSSLKISMFLTPSLPISNLTYSISKPPNISLQSHPTNFDHIDQKKQVKITHIVKAKSFPYNLPKITFRYTKGGYVREFGFLLPCSVNKFIELVPPSSAIEFQAGFQIHKSNLVTTERLRINKKVGRISCLMELLPGLEVVSRVGEGVRYGAIGQSEGSAFHLRIICQGSKYITIQGHCQQEPQFLEYYINNLVQILASPK